MKNSKRIIALVLALSALFTVLCACAFAANVKFGTNLTATVITGKRSWLILNPTITVRNTGNTLMVVHCEDSRGALKQVRISAGKTATIHLKPNQRYFVYWGSNLTMGNWEATGVISAGRGIKEIY